MLARGGQSNPIVNPNGLHQTQSAGPIGGTSTNIGSLSRTSSLQRSSSIQSTLSRTDSSKTVAGVQVDVVEDPLAVHVTPDLECTILSTFVDKAAVVLALKHIMDEHQVAALICHGLAQLDEHNFSGNEKLALRIYLGLCVSLPSSLPFQICTGFRHVLFHGLLSIMLLSDWQLASLTTRLSS